MKKDDRITLSDIMHEVHTAITVEFHYRVEKIKKTKDDQEKSRLIHELSDMIQIFYNYLSAIWAIISSNLPDGYDTKFSREGYVSKFNEGVKMILKGEEFKDSPLKELNRFK